MHRILVIGCSGAGKSTLARHIGERLRLPVIHLDREYWKAGWVEPGKAEWRTRVEELAARSEWVMDGNYGGTFEIRVPRATAIVYLDFPRWRCVARVLRRTVSGYGKTRPDMADGCPERFNWAFLKFVWDYPRRSRAGAFDMLAKLRPDQYRVVLRTPAEVRAFVTSLTDSLTSSIPEPA